MNALELWHLKNYCKKHSLDIQEIDKTLTYSENLQRLEKFVIPDFEELAQAYARTYEDWEKSLTIGDKAGVPDSALATFPEVQQIRIKAVMKYSFRLFKIKPRFKIKDRFKATRKINDIIKGYIDLCAGCPFAENCRARVKLEISRYVIKAYGTTTALMMVLDRLEGHKIRFQIVRLRMRTKGLTWVSGKGWVKKWENAYAVHMN